MNFKLTKSSLNFKVYTSPTIPSSGAENDIVIISATPMENWILSSDTPVGEPRNSGDVWIQYSVSGNVFDIMNQHDFMLAITKVYQYVGKTWMSVNARRYVGGVWNVVSTAFSATISITYPANSTCVVTNSIGQTVASDTNATSSTKTWTATVNATDTYTVTATATDGSEKSKSQDVSIESDGQSVSVSLNYQLVLFDNGTVGVPISLGYKNYPANSVTIGDVIAINAAKNDTTTPSHASAVTDEKIDISDYSTLYVSTTYREVTDGTYGAVWLLVGKNRTASVYNYGNAPKGWTASASVDEIGVTSLDVSTLTGEYYIGLGCAYAAAADFDKWWLE